MRLKRLMQMKGRDTFAGMIVLQNFLDVALNNMEAGKEENYDYIFSVIVSLYTLSNNVLLGTAIAKNYLDRFIELVPKEWYMEEKQDDSIQEN